jgi:dihydropyrimidinase
MKTLVKNGTIVTATDHFRGDVLVDGSTIALVGSKIDVAADRTLDATDRYLIPGGIDVHTHLDMPFGGTTSSDDFESGTIAAAFGGTTSIIDYACHDRGHSLREGFDTWSAKAAGRAVVDYGFHMCLREATPAILAEMEEMVREGITSFKLFTAYPGVFLLDDGEIFRIMRRGAELGATICMHAENGLVIDALVTEALARGDTSPAWHARTRPALAEAEATHRAIVLAELAGAQLYVVHLSAAESLEEIVAARARGHSVIAETCPQYLLLTDECYDAPDFGGAKYVMSPPLRDRARQHELWRGLRTGDLRVVATDHCPFDFATQKQLGRCDFSRIPNGAPGIENRISLLHDGGVLAGNIDLRRWVEVISTAPAKTFGLFPRKGTIAPGSDADLVLFDPKGEMTISAATHHMRVDYNPYEGRTVRGVTETVLSRGELVIDRGTFVGRAGHGEFLRRSTR